MLTESAAKANGWLSSWWASILFAATLLSLPADAAPLVPQRPVPSADVPHLIEQLGSSDFTTREAATRQLHAKGDAVVDSLLEAAHQQDDLEVALRARWLLEGIPLVRPTDPAQVGELLDGFAQRSAKGQFKALTQLIRLEHNAGVEPLARLARVSPSTGLAQLAADVLVQEWEPANPHWPSLADAILSGVGSSQRPAACVLRALAGFSEAADNPATPPAESLAALDRLETAVNAVLKETDTLSDDSPPGNLFTNESSLRLSREVTPWLLLKCLTHAAVQAGQEARGITYANQLFDRGYPWEGNTDDAKANLLFWAADIGVAAIINHLPKDVTEGPEVQPLTLYAAAWCERQQGNQQRAATLADQAHALAADDLVTQLTLATQLKHWGIFDWTEREFTRVLSAETLRQEAGVQLAILWIEFLNDQENFTAAADATQALLASESGRAQQLNRLKHLGYSPEALAARGHYFRSRAAHAAGDFLAERQALKAALSVFSAELDTLIAYYHLPDLTPDEQVWIRDQITKAAASLQQRIAAEPENPNPLNEYAWLVANTEGDLAQATRYSKRSLTLAFDSASYLDTLAHCYAAAGEPLEAVRCQLVARRHEPGSLTIEKNLQKFLALTEQP